MNRKAMDAITMYNMIHQGDRVYAAVSGGADSVALLHALWCMKDALGITLSALHLNHNLREEESEGDEVFVRELCNRLDIPLQVGSGDVSALAEMEGLSLEEAARQVRYAFFALSTKSVEGNVKIATAHTASDNIETVLLNLARGTGLRGLCGIPPVRDNIIRPLIRCSREEIEAYCRGHQLSYVSDSSNFSLDYTRNKLRHKVVPVLREQNPRLEEAVTALADTLRADEAYLERQAVRALQSVALGDNRYRRHRFLLLPEALRPRLLRLLLRERGLRYDHRRLELLEKQIRLGQGGVQLSGQVALHCGPEEFSLASPGEKRLGWNENQLSLRIDDCTNAPMTVCFGEKRLRFQVEILGKNEKTINFAENQYKNALDCDRIEKIVNLRHRLPGEKMRPAGRGVTKPVRRLLSEAGIPAAMRDSVLILADSRGPIWVEGMGVSELAAVSSHTGRVCHIEVMEEQTC